MVQHTPPMRRLRRGRPLFCTNPSLKTSYQVTGQHQWVADGTSLLSGRYYFNCHKVRIGALATRSRTTRGRRGDRLCRAGCMAQETNNHVLQICPRAHKARIDRHDGVLSYLGRNLRRQGFNVHEEPHYRTQIGLRKPDIVATMGTLGLVIDAHCRRAVWPRESQDCQNQEIRRQSWHRTGHTEWDRSNQHPSPTGHPLLQGYLMQNIRMRFSNTEHHHPERSRCHRHPGAHRWYHRPPRLQSLNRGHVRKMTSPKRSHPFSSVLLAVLRHKLLYLICVT